MPRSKTAGLIAAALTALTLNATAAAEFIRINGTKGSALKATVIASFDSPWAMTFVDETNLLVTTKPGMLWLVAADGTKQKVAGVPKVAAKGQGGLGDVVLAPDFTTSGTIYLSMVETLDKGATRGAVVISATLDRSSTPKLTNLKKIWTQEPKMTGAGHFSHRIAFGPAGTPHEGKIFITSGDRQKQKPAQNWDMALGKIIRLNADGSTPDDNPWQDKGELAKTYWSVGHRNLLGIHFDAENRLWSHEMGPKHGDELNLIQPGKNYGWPIVSNGDNYSGIPIPDHNTRPEFEAPKASWVPSIAPSGLVIYSGDTFKDWQGDAFIGGLVSKALIRVDLKGKTAKEAERYVWGKRIREVEQGPSGALWVLEDKSGARLLKLEPAG